MSRYYNLYLGPSFQVTAPRNSGYNEPPFIEVEARLYSICNIDFLANEDDDIRYCFIPARKLQKQFGGEQLSDVAIGFACLKPTLDPDESNQQFQRYYSRDIERIQEFYQKEGMILYCSIHWVT